MEKWKTTKEVLEKYEDLKEDDSINHVFTKHKPDYIEKIKNIKCGDNVANYGGSSWRLIPDKPARTVMENHGSVHVHYKKNRRCTPRELAVLQSFDDDFVFKGTKSSILKQIGNAVPPLLSRKIAEKIKDLMS